VQEFEQHHLAAVLTQQQLAPAAHLDGKLRSIARDIRGWK
jgi:hypothetical protein